MISLLYVLLKGSLMREVLPKFFDIDLGAAIIAYVMISYGSTWAGVFALGLGLAVDVFSAGPVGLFSLLYLAVFLSIHGGCRFFDLHSSKGQVILISMAVYLKALLLLLLLLIFSYEVRGASSLVVLSGVSAIVTGLLSPLGFYFLNLLSRVATNGLHEA
jgi:hypothetical protein